MFQAEVRIVAPTGLEHLRRSLDTDHQAGDRRIAPTRLELLRQSLEEVVGWLLVLGGIRKTIEQLSRDELIRLRYEAGEILSELARAFGISPQRVYQVVNFESK